MRVLLVNSIDLSGGAARAAYRLHQGLVSIGVDSTMLVQNKTSDDYRVIGPVSKSAKALAKLRPTLDALPLYSYRNRSKIPLSTAWLPDQLPKKVCQLNPDVVHLHWIAGGFVRIETLAKIRKPIVWTLHDMWAFTGGCHYDEGCGRYKVECGECPVLGSNKRRDLAYRVWKRKHKAWQGLKLTVVTPSRWQAECVKASQLLGSYSVKVIPNGLDLTQYKPVEKAQARVILGLPQDKKLILCGSIIDPRKGFELLRPALHRLATVVDRTQYAVLIFGASEPKQQLDFGFEAYYLGHLYDDISLAILYSAADVFVAPSKQDNLPNTVMEALACGTPCVAFNIGGMPDMIENLINGYLARPFDIEDFAYAISWVLSDSERHQALSQAARKKVESEFELTKVAKRYVKLYETLVG
ncbi:MAG: glycosyltransferase [Desulfobacterales bacterium]|nr:glycosyltransferase [Desulfobacterales bacterium]